MTVEFGSPDTLPYVCAVYHCAQCGRLVEQRGQHAGELPRGWVSRGRDDDVEHVCSACARSTPTPTPRP